MLIYGARAVLLKKEQPTRLTCPSCGSQGSLSISVFRKHAHFFWIPLFPIGRTGLSECLHCKNTLVLKEMPVPVKEAYITMSSSASGPKWQYFGIGILPLLIMAAIYSGDKTKEKELSLIAQPRVGDVYHYKYDDEYFSTMKVVAVGNDSVFVVYNSTAITSTTDLKQVTKEENYIVDIVEAHAIQEVKNKYLTKEIIGVIR